MKLSMPSGMHCTYLLPLKNLMCKRVPVVHLFCVSRVFSRYSGRGEKKIFFFSRPATKSGKIFCVDLTLSQIVYNYNYI